MIFWSQTSYIVQLKLQVQYLYRPCWCAGISHQETEKILGSVRLPNLINRLEVGSALKKLPSTDI
jgi:hypothetical protein